MMILQQWRPSSRIWRNQHQGADVVFMVVFDYPMTVLWFPWLAATYFFRKDGPAVMVECSNASLEMNGQRSALS
jgi:hypothetical protein